MNPSPAAPEGAQRERLSVRMRRSPATAALIVTFIVVWVATWFDPDHLIVLRLAKVNDRVRAGEWWRLFTASFLHAGALHLWFNGTALASIGPIIERVYGKAQYLVAFLVGGSVGMLASVAFTPNPSVGASAGVFALLGVLLAYAVRARRSLPPQARRALIVQVLFVVGLNVVIGILAVFIDNAAHLGGLVGGFALGLVLRPRAPIFVSPAAERADSNAQPARAAPPTRLPGRSYLGWAGQRWRMVVLVVSMIAFGVSMTREITEEFPGWGILAAVIGATIALRARCPRCKARVFWWCLSKLPHDKGLRTAFAAQACPLCGYPDAPNPPVGSRA